jgi:carbon-monoxide dehydrogenase medium subunit
MAKIMVARTQRRTGIASSSLVMIAASTRRIPQVKAPSFAYAKPRSPEEAFELARRPGAKVLAGGQSLIPALNMRLAQPELLVDISGLPFKDITLEQGVLRIGALVTHSQIEKSGEIARHAPLLAQAVRHVAHPAIRNRGTVGGSIALADPAAEYPACMVALDASIVVAGAGGERLVKAQQFFKGLFEVDLAPGELVAALEVPAQLKDQRSVFLELARRHGDYAIIGLAAYKGKSTRFVFCGAGPTPMLARRASQSADLEEAQKLLEQDLDPPADLYNSSATKLHLAKVLLKRAWNTLSTSA